MRELDCFSSSGRAYNFEESSLTPLALASSSKGNQRKWYAPAEAMYVKERFYYQDKYWNDDYVEVIAATIAKQFRNCSPVLEQYPCHILTGDSSRRAVCSRDFSSTFGEFVPFKRAFSMDSFAPGMSIAAKWNTIESKLTGFVGLENAQLYLTTMVVLDYLVGNEDRHFNNFGFCKRGCVTGLAPLFDFGLGLFEHDERYTAKRFRDCLHVMEGKPFSTDLYAVIQWVMLQPRLKVLVVHMLPTSIDLHSIKIPSMKAGSYLLWAAKQLGISLRGVE